MEFVSKDVGITDQDQKQKSFELLCNEIGPIPIGVAKRASHLSVSMGEQLLCMHMEDKNKAKTIAEALNGSFYHHGYALSRTEAAKIGLPVIIPDDKLEQLLWDVWTDVCDEMECDKPFSPLEILHFSGQTATIFGPIPTVNIPPNLPSQLQQQLLNQALQQITLVNYTNPIDYELLFAILESIYCKSEVRVPGKISAARMPDMNLAINDIRFPKGWTFSVCDV